MSNVSAQTPNSEASTISMEPSNSEIAATCSISMEPSSDSPTCRICLDELGKAAEVARPSVCGHLFCRGCLENLCREDPSLRRCPLDRKPFDLICVRRQTEAAETVLWADTLTPLKRLLPSHDWAFGLAVLLLIMLWLSPSWLLAAHIAVVVRIYWSTGGILNWNQYVDCIVVFYTIMVPWRLFGLLLTIYVRLFCLLIIFWLQQQIIVIQASQYWRETSIVLVGVCGTVSVICPSLISTNELAQIYCYIFVLMLMFTLNVSLISANSHRQYAQHAFLLSHFLLATFLCWLLGQNPPYVAYSYLPEFPGTYLRYEHSQLPSWIQESSLSDRLTIYYCLLILYLLFRHEHEKSLSPNVHYLIKITCQLTVLKVVFDISQWQLVYSFLWNEYFIAYVLSHLSAAFTHLRVSGHLILNIFVAGLLLHFATQLFGWSSITVSILGFLCSGAVLEFAFSQDFFQNTFGFLLQVLSCQTFLLVFQLFVFGIFLPAVLVA